MTNDCVGLIRTNFEYDLGLCTAADSLELKRFLKPELLADLQQV